MKVKSNYLRMADGGELVSRWAARQPMQGAGEVPGKGSGDKIPALYEPGESVVSNDMMQAAPGLREELRSLRGEVLAQKGTTPDEADAKAMRGEMLRAEEGLVPNNNEAVARSRLAAKNQVARTLRIASSPLAPMTAPPPPSIPGTSLGAAAPSNAINYTPTTEPLRAELAPKAVTPAAAPFAPANPNFQPPSAGAVNTPWTSANPNPRLSNTGALAAQRLSEASQAQQALSAQQGAARTATLAQDAAARAAAETRAAGAALNAASPVGAPAGGTAPTGTTPLGATPTAAATPTAGGAAQPSMLRSIGNGARSGLETAGKGVKFLATKAGPVGAAYELGDGIYNNDGWKATKGAADVAASTALFTPAAPAAATYLAGRGLYEGSKMAAGGINSALGETGRDNVGRVINRTLRNAGGFLGLDVGVDDSKLVAQQAAAAAPGANKTYPTGPNQTAATADRTGLRLDGRTQLNTTDPRIVAPEAEQTSAAPAQPQFGQPYSPLRAGTPEYAAAAKMIDDSDVYVPRGTGAMRNNSTGKIVSFDSRSYAPTPGPTQDQLRRAYAPTQYASPAATSAPAPALREKPTSWVDEMRQRKDDRLEADRVLSRRNTDENNATSRFNNSESNSTSRFNNENTNETSRLNNSETNRTNLRGQDLDYEGKMAPARLAAQQRALAAQVFNAAGGNNALAAQMMQSQGMDPKNFLDTQASLDTSETNRQALGTKARENVMKEFRVFDSKDPSKVDEAASQQSFDAVRQIFPGIDSADENTRNKFMPDAKEMHEIFKKARTQDKVNWDNARVWETKRPNLSSMPNAVGLRDEEVGSIAGMFMVNASGGDTLLRRKDGTSLNLGRLNERQRELLARAQKTGWGK